MFRNYYHCLIAGLPDLFLDETEVNFSMHDFKDQLKNDLYRKDYRLVELLFLPYDNTNLFNILQENYDDFNSIGNFTMEEFERELNEEEALSTLPVYMYSFANRFREDKKKKTLKQWENDLTREYFDYVLQVKNKFIQNWYTFEQNITNILAGLNCRKFELDPEEELIGDNFITDAIKSSTAKDFGLEVDFEEISQIINLADKDSLLAREKGIDQFKWEKLNELTLFDYFSIEVVLAYTLKLKMIYRWMSLDEKTGKQMFDKLIQELKSSLEFPKEFTINEQKR